MPEETLSKKIYTKNEANIAAHKARKKFLKELAEKQQTTKFSLALADIIELASPSEGITGFIEENLEENPLILGAPKPAGDKHGYEPSRVRVLLKSWAGEAGKAWRKENGFETDEERSIRDEEAAKEKAGQEPDAGKGDDENEE